LLEVGLHRAGIFQQDTHKSAAKDLAGVPSHEVEGEEEDATTACEAKAAARLASNGKILTRRATDNKNLAPRGEGRSLAEE
jgi:hypothetical protein